MNSRKQVLDWLESDPSSTRYITAARRLDEISDEALPEIRVALLRNIVIEPIVPYLKVHSSRSGLQLRLQLGNYDNLQEDVFQAGSPLFEFKPDVVVMALRLQLLAPKLVLSYTSLSSAESEDLAAQVLARVDRRSEVLSRSILKDCCPALGMTKGSTSAIGTLGERPTVHGCSSN